MTVSSLLSIWKKRTVFFGGIALLNFLHVRLAQLDPVRLEVEHLSQQLLGACVVEGIELTCQISDHLHALVTDLARFFPVLVVDRPELLGLLRT